MFAKIIIFIYYLIFLFGPIEGVGSSPLHQIIDFTMARRIGTGSPPCQDEKRRPAPVNGLPIGRIGVRDDPEHLRWIGDCVLCEEGDTQEHESRVHGPLQRTNHTRLSSPDSLVTNRIRPD